MVDTPKVNGGMPGREIPDSFYLDESGFLTPTNTLKTHSVAQNVFAIRDLPGALGWNVIYNSVERWLANDTRQLSTWTQELETHRRNLAAIKTTAMDMPNQIKGLGDPLRNLNTQAQDLKKRNEAFIQAVTLFSPEVVRFKSELTSVAVQCGQIFVKNKAHQRETAALMAQGELQQKTHQDLSQCMQSLENNVTLLRTRSATNLSTISELNKKCSNDDSVCDTTFQRVDAAIERLNKATSEWKKEGTDQTDTDVDESDYLNNLQDDLSRMENGVFVYLINEIWRSITSLFQRQQPRPVGRAVRAVIQEEIPSDKKPSL